MKTHLILHINILRDLLKKFTERIDNEYESIYEICKKRNKIIQEVDNSWIGQWAHDNFNHYRDFEEGTNNVCSHTYGGLIDYIDKKSDVTIKSITDKLDPIISLFENLQESCIIELAVIRDFPDQYKKEIKLLDEIENHKWGIEELDYLELQKPNEIQTNYANAQKVRNRGLDVPPHIAIKADMMVIGTKIGSIAPFSKVLKRLIRQLELKLNLSEGTLNEEEYIVQKLVNLFNKFHIVARQLEKRHGNKSTIKIEDEYDVQDLLHALLKIHFEDVRPEEYVSSFGGRRTRMDFLLKREKIVIEVKKTRPSLGDNRIGDELIQDIVRYSTHEDCETLICFVYDPDGFISNPRGIEDDLEKLGSNNLIVKVYIKP